MSGDAQGEIAVRMTGNDPSCFWVSNVERQEGFASVEAPFCSGSFSVPVRTDSWNLHQFHLFPALQLN